MSLRYGGRHPKERLGQPLSDEDFFDMMAMARAEDEELERRAREAKTR